jgi:hypothetical protein
LTDAPGNSKPAGTPTGRSRKTGITKNTPPRIYYNFQADELINFTISLYPPIAIEPPDSVNRRKG